jgi:guanylate kinase
LNTFFYVNRHFDEVCGPSGVGKGTIISRFMEESAASPNLPKFGFSVSHTTRQPRPGEINGTHYNFVTREFFEEKIACGDFFIEYAEVHGNMYGTSFQAIFDVTKVRDDEAEIQNVRGAAETQCLLDIDVAGVKSIKEFQARQERLGSEPVLGKAKSTQQYATNNNQELPLLCANFIFIAPPSVDTLRERLLNRGTETQETLERRFNNAQAELEYGMAPGNFDAIIVNDNIEKACSDFATTVMDMYLAVK